MPPLSEQEPRPTPSAREAQTINERIADLWKGMPPDDKARLVMSLLDEVLAGEYREAVVNSLGGKFASREDRLDVLLHSQPTSPAKLLQIGYDEKQVEQLTSQDLVEIAARVRRSYLYDIYWQELQYHALAVMEEKEVE